MLANEVLKKLDDLAATSGGAALKKDLEASAKELDFIRQRGLECQEAVDITKVRGKHLVFPRMV